MISILLKFSLYLYVAITQQKQHIIVRFYESNELKMLNLQRIKQFPVQFITEFNRNFMFVELHFLITQIFPIMVKIMKC